MIICSTQQRPVACRNEDVYPTNINRSVLVVSMWRKSEIAILKRLSSPERVQDFLDSLPYRCEDGHLSARAALRDGRAHCFDGSLLAAASLRRSGHRPALIDLCAERDDDHMLCAFRWRGYWGAVAKSNFPGLRFREPIFRSARELVVSYFEFYFNLDKEKTLRAFSRPFELPDTRRLDWECDDAVGDIIVERLSQYPHYTLVAPHHTKNLRSVDHRLYRSQLVGVNRRGVYGQG